MSTAKHEKYQEKMAANVTLLAQYEEQQTRLKKGEQLREGEIKIDCKRV